MITDFKEREGNNITPLIEEMVLEEEEAWPREVMEKEISETSMMKSKDNSKLLRLRRKILLREKQPNLRKLLKNKRKKNLKRLLRKKRMSMLMPRLLMTTSLRRRDLLLPREKPEKLKKSRREILRKLIPRKKKYQPLKRT